MNEHIDLSQFDVWPDGRPDTHHKYGEVLRHATEHSLWHLTSDAQQTLDYLERMVADQHDIADEIKEAEILGRGFLLKILLLKSRVTGVEQ